jgi:hypothetical protein
MREQVRAHVEEEALADPRGEHVVAEREQRSEERQTDVCERDRQEHADVARDEHLVDDDAEQPDLDRLDGGDREQGQQAESDAPAVGARERPEPPQEVPDRDLRSGGYEALPVRLDDEQGSEASADDGASGVRVAARVRAAAAAAAAPATAAAAGAGVGAGAGGRGRGAKRRDDCGELHECLPLVVAGWNKEDCARAT